MNVAIYSRKSKFTGKGESIHNQIELCSEYAKLHFEHPNILVYEDEGFSGGNTDRPQFQQLLIDAKEHKFDVLICYRLDRVSRNIADFATLIDKLQLYNIGFVSLKEQFDTTTPMGRAMMNISSVFAQLERETIAERVRDNMLQLAKTGRWLGGITPTGYESEEVSICVDGKTKRLYKLIPIENEIELVNLIFDKFLELRSLTKLESYLIQNDIKTKNNKNYCIAAIKLILTNPVYCAADQLAYEYLNKKGCLISAEKVQFNGSKGIMPYNRTKQNLKGPIRKNSSSEWIISIGDHEPIVNSIKWINVQTILDKNKDKSIRRVRSQNALLSGLLKCEKCGSYMRPKASRKSADGTITHYYYICELKEKSHKEKCSVKNITGHVLDNLVINKLCDLAINTSDLAKSLDDDKNKLTLKTNDISKQINQYESHIKDLESSISNLLNNLSQSSNSIANEYILSEIEKMGTEIKLIQKKIDTLQLNADHTQNEGFNLELMKKTLLNFNENINNATIEEKRDLIRILVEDIYWNGEDLKVNIFGANSLKKH